MAELWRRSLGTYDGRLMRCAPGTHEAAAVLVQRHVPRDARVLDLAAGTGAWLARLRDGGYRDLSAVELNVAGFHFDGVTPRPIDLNTEFAGAFDAPFGLVTAVEIIEHLDAPRHFVRNVRDVLAPGGYFLLTTPNVAHWVGRVRFAMSGSLRHFRINDYHYQRHISPITDVQMRLMLEEVGFDVVESTTAGTFFGTAKRALLAPWEAAMRIMFGPLATGDVSIYLARKSDRARSDSPGADSFYFRTTGA
jgi:2-polyprenyl-3-methyl-5-hydroxy-6-metoxy-1,4-benzoquinol methylase